MAEKPLLKIKIGGAAPEGDELEQMATGGEEYAKLEEQHISMINDAIALIDKGDNEGAKSILRQLAGEEKSEGKEAVEGVEEKSPKEMSFKEDLKNRMYKK